MQTMTNAEIIDFNGWTLKVRPTESSTPRLLVMIHGFTGDENSMWVFGYALSHDYWMFAPRAPHAADPGGFSWRPRLEGTFGRPSFEMLKPAADDLIKAIDEYAASVNIDPAQFDVIGFSQGGAMVSLLGFLYPNRIRKMGVLAGFVPSGADEIISQKPLAGKKVFVAHGTLDEMIPVDRARESVEQLEAAGAQVDYCEDEARHKMSAKMLRAMEAYLKD